jgi:hypothetical protein
MARCFYSSSGPSPFPIAYWNRWQLVVERFAGLPEALSGRVCPLAEGGVALRGDPGEFFLAFSRSRKRSSALPGPRPLLVLVSFQISFLFSLVNWTWSLTVSAMREGTLPGGPDWIQFCDVHLVLLARTPRLDPSLSSRQVRLNCDVAAVQMLRLV